MGVRTGNVGRISMVRGLTLHRSGLRRRMSGNRQTTAWGIRCRAWFAHAMHTPEFRIAILVCTMWLLLIQAYQPWRHHSYNRSSVLEQVSFFFWRVGYNISGSGPVAVAVGLSSICLLAYMLGWVIRSFIRANATAASSLQSAAASVAPASFAAEWREWVGRVLEIMPEHSVELLATDTGR
jgi:hypothetical protein